MDTVIIQRQYHLKHCVPLSRPRLSNTNNPNPLCNFGFWVSKVSEGFCLKTIDYNTNTNNNSMTITDSAFHTSHEDDDEQEEEELQVKAAKMEDLIQKKKEPTGKVDTFGSLVEDKGRESSGSSDFLSSRNEEQSRSSTVSSSSSSSSSPPSVGWPVQKIAASNCTNVPRRIRQDEKKKQNLVLPDMEMMKERFARLLLGEDMSGCGNGVPTALAISNAITNLCGTLFGQILRLEPVAETKKAMWRREMEWFLSVSDHIVELAPSSQTSPDGSKVEVMSCRPRTDLYVNLPALRKLDNMLLEILESFVNTEFWYVDKGVISGSDGNDSRARGRKREEEKWWLPVPRVPPSGLRQSLRKKLQHKRDCTNQILKAAQAINTITLAEMDIPDSYLESLPKTGRACLGDVIYGHITSDQFSPECVLDCLDLSSELQAMEIANKVEASIYIWRKRTNFNSKPSSNNSTGGRHSTKTSWEMVKDLMVDGDKWDLLAERAESIMLCLRQRFPGLPQTSLDVSKIQYNKDVGKAILESYSRVLESIAFNIVARIDDVMYVDDLTKYSGNHFPVPIPSTPSRASISTPTLTPSRTFSPLKPESTPPYINNSSTTSNFGQRGGGVKRILTDYLSIDTKGDNNRRNSVEKLDPTSKTSQEVSAFEKEVEPKLAWA